MDSFTQKITGKFKKTSRKRRKNYAVLSIALLIFFGGVFFVWISTLKIPTLDSFAERKVVESTKIFDRTGEILLYDVNQNIKRTAIPFEEISRNIKNATIAIEDREFYQHNGIKPTAIIRATLSNVLSLGYSQGGSTITQQVIKNALLTKDKLLSRKIKEWVLALKLEKVISKDEILSLYLNEMPYGGALYGVEEASQTYFGKSASDVTLTESAYLAAMLQAPTFYSPYGNHKERLEGRKNLVLQEMFRNGFITEEELTSAKKEKVVFKIKNTDGIKAPHFVFFVIEELNKKYGEDMVRDGGLRVITTLDYQIEMDGEEIANKYALSNKESFNAENASFVVIDPKTGGILAMVGSRNYFDEEIDGNFNVTTAHRQPGSTFKPFVYAQAFLGGYTPETVLFDAKTQFGTECAPNNLSNEAPCYSPNNYDGVFRGPITLRESLAQSINVTSVKVLYLAGIRNSIKLAESLGIESLGNADQYGLTLVLGGGEVTPLEMTSAYSVFANEGVRNPYTGILEVKDRWGNILQSLQLRPVEVLPKDVAYKISSILSDNNARAPSYGQTSALHFPDRDVAVKTGTTNDSKDAWILGYTPSVTLGAWAGNNDNTPMVKKVAGLIVAPMWRAYMDKILERMPVESFPEPIKDDSFDLKPVLRGYWQGGISNKVDTISGKNATIYTPRETMKEILGGGVHSILYWLNKNDPRGPAPTNPSDDPQFASWEFGVESWLQSSGYIQNPIPTLPQGDDDVHGPEFAPKVSITSPVALSSLPIDRLTSVSVLSQGRFPVAKVEYFVNGVYLGDRTTPPFIFSFIPNELSFLNEVNDLRVVVYDSVFNSGEATTQFKVLSP